MNRMRYHTHVVTSLALGACIASYASFPFTIGYASGVVIGSVLPDIDEPKSFIGRRSLGVSNQVKKAYGHRGMTHSVLVWAVIAAVFIAQSPSLFTYGFIIGYLLHIVEDFFSVQGVPLFWPIQTKRYKSFITYRTAGLLEKLIYYASFVMLIVWMIRFDMYKDLLSSFLELVRGIITYFL